MASYDYNKIDEFVEVITNELGGKALYTSFNKKYPTGCKNYFLRYPESLLDILVEYFNDRSISKEIYTLERKNNKSFLGAYINNPDYIYINIILDSSECWQRFASVKEFCSAFVGHYQSAIVKNTIYQGEEDYAESVEEAFERQISKINTDGLIEGDMDCETFAILLAAELMIPKKHRDKTKALLEQVDDNDHPLTLNDVAKSLMIPEAVLRFFKEKGRL